jgi:hypothetical protein
MPVKRANFINFFKNIFNKKQSRSQTNDFDNNLLKIKKILEKQLALQEKLTKQKHFDIIKATQNTIKYFNDNVLKSGKMTLTDINGLGHEINIETSKLDLELIGFSKDYEDENGWYINGYIEEKEGNEKKMIGVEVEKDNKDSIIGGNVFLYDVDNAKRAGYLKARIEDFNDPVYANIVQGVKSIEIEDMKIELAPLYFFGNYLHKHGQQKQTDNIKSNYDYIFLFENRVTNRWCVFFLKSV